MLRVLDLDTKQQTTMYSITVQNADRTTSNGSKYAGPSAVICMNRDLLPVRINPIASTWMNTIAPKHQV